LVHSYPFQYLRQAAHVPLYASPARFFRHNDETIADQLQDVFTFSFGGEEGSFVIGKDGSIMPLQDTKLKIEKFEEDMSANGIISRISKFIITTTSGIQYIFNDKELSKVISYESAPPVKFFTDPPIANRDYFLSRPSYKVNNYSVVNSWYLSEIVNPQTSEKITFDYEGYNLEYVVNQSAVQVVETVDDGFKETIQWMQNRFNGQLKRISRINLPDSTAVAFKYFDTYRVDMPGDKALKQIVMMDGETEKYGYLFNYQYFSKNALRSFTYSFPSDEVGNARLSLLSVQKTGQNSVVDKPYLFSYYAGSASLGTVPARAAASQDHWGYYNSTTTYPYDNELNIHKNLQNLFLPRYRVVGTDVMVRGGMLKSVTYPTGGTQEYEYELNTAFVNNTVVKAGGLRVKKTTQSDDVDPNQKIVTEYRYVDEEGRSSAWGYEEPVYTGQSQTVLVLPGGSSYYAAHPAYSLATNVAYRLPDLIKENLPKANVAFLNTPWGFLLVTAVSYIVQQWISPGLTVTEKSTTNSYSNHPKNQNSLPLSYSRVEVYKGTITENLGKTVFEYTSNKDFPVLVANYQQPYSNKSRYATWAYGLLKRATVFNKLNEPVREVFNKYSCYAAEYKNQLFASFKCEPTKTLVCPTANFSSYSHMIGLMTEFYYPLRGRSELDYSVEKNFSNNSDYIMQRTDYSYDPDYYNLKKTTTVNSLGETIEKRVYYPYDYNITGALTEMKDKNMLYLPVASETWLLKDGTEAKLLSAEVADYQKTVNGDYKPAKKYRLNSIAPIPLSTIGEFDPTKLNRNGSVLKAQESFTYNNQGKMIQVAAFGRVEANIYDDYGEGLIAKAANTDVNSIAYSSFEDGAAGNWTITPVAGASPIISDATAPTGKRSIYLGEVTTITKTGLDPNKKMIISYWSKGGTVNISGSSKLSEKTGAVINGWTLKVIKLSGSSSISVNGTGYLDELRLHPEDAEMLTQTYNEWRTIASQTGTDNISTYYEYDELGRMKCIRDMQKNIVQSHEYKYKQ